MKEVICKKPWKKNLYENIGYPDNYTDETFLRELRKNVYKKDITPTQAILAAGVVTEKLCIVIIFSVMFTYLYEGWVTPEEMFSYSSIVVCVLYIVYMKYHCPPSRRIVLGSIVKLVVIFLVFGYILSPLLKTLTDTVSTDTIYATSSFMMMVHMVFHDYNFPAAIVSSSLSLNAAIFSSVCLASRLQTSFHAFVFLTLSAEFFVLYPYFSHTAVKITTPFLITITSVTFVLVLSISIVLGFLYLWLSVLINVICPILFFHWQKYKENIYGPWDEAVIKYEDN